VHDMLAAPLPSQPLIHDGWSMNAFLETRRDDDVSGLDAVAAAKVTRTLRTSRQCMAPIEGRGVLAEWDPRLEQMIITTSTQMPHVTKSGLADCLGLDEGQVRIVSPDVGGGFGYKGILLPEEIVCASIARQLGRPVRWLEDRYEQLTGANCREHHYVITAWADRAGRLLGVECEATVDAGAYSSYPFGACLEAAQIGSILPGPYILPLLRCHTISACTNKPPILPYRGVARTGVCYAMETTLDALARQLGITAEAIRFANLVPPDAMPYRNLVGKVFDSGDYPESLRRAVAAFDLDALRARRARGETVGFGLATFCEQGAHGTSVYHAWGIPFVPGFEQAYVRLSPDGVLEVRVGVHSHGQGMETTLAQVAHEILGIHPDKVRVVHGDTALTPYSTGTWGSRAMVMAGGAVAEACRQLGERIAAIGAALLQVRADEVEIADGKVRRKDSVGVDGGGSVSIADVAYTWYRAPQNLPPGVNKGGLEITAGYRPDPDTGTHSYACHAAVVTVDTATGAVVLEDYLIVEDGGKLVNPMIVDGQVLGGLAQGIGTALYEEMPYDETGQPLAVTLADYLLPGTTDVPDVRLDHMETLSPWTTFGQKGIGESGAIGPPAAIVNAINDALAPLGAEVTDLPASPPRVLAAIAAARAAKR
jgi:carbon-monoxide dehydrogenase large subunit